MRIFKALSTYMRYDIPLWLMGVLTNWWPDLGPITRIRGILTAPFMRKCGRRFAVGRDVTILAPERLTIGNDVYFAKGTWLNAFGNVEIEDEVMTGPYVVISSSNHGFKNGSCKSGGTHPAPVKIGKGSWLGAHVVITAGVTVGRGNLIGANAVLTKSTPDNVFVAGVPAKVIGIREDNPSEIKSRHE
jgi:acetyltransferase-like isoleucine patch superfamily enzyme